MTSGNMSWLLISNEDFLVKTSGGLLMMDDIYCPVRFLYALYGTVKVMQVEMEININTSTFF